MKSDPSTKKIGISIDGKAVEAEIIDVKREENSAIILHLENDVILRLKTDVVQVLRIPDPSGDDNKAFYRVQSGNMLSVVGFVDDHPN